MLTGRPKSTPQLVPRSCGVGKLLLFTRPWWCLPTCTQAKRAGGVTTYAALTAAIEQLVAQPGCVRDVPDHEVGGGPRRHCAATTLRQ